MNTTITEPRARKGQAYWVVAGGFGGLLIVGLAFAVFIYFRLIRYERVAAQHLPRDTTFALRLDVEQVILYEPFRKHLMPLVNRGRLPRGASKVLSPRLDRIKQRTGIELGVDIRELLLARGGGQDWLLVLGGKFPRSGVVRGMHEVFTEEGLDARLAPDEQSLSLPSGVAFGQAADGALLLASSPDRLRQAVPEQQPPAELGLESARGAAFAFLASPGRAALGEMWGTLDPASLDRLPITHASGTVKLASVPLVEARLRLAPGADTGRVQGDILALIRRAGDRNEAGSALERPAKGSEFQARVASPQELRVSGEWQRQDIDRAAESLALWLQKAIDG